MVDSRTFVDVALRRFGLGVESQLGFGVGSDVGFVRPSVLVALPIVAVVLWYLLFRRRGTSDARRRTRLLLFGSRLVIVGCLITAAAGPYTVSAREVQGDPHVTMLVDESASMTVVPSTARELAREIEAQGVPVTVSVIASGNESPVGEGIIANLGTGGSVVVVSDGQVTEGRTLSTAAELARTANVTINAVELPTRETERYVHLHGPSKVSAGIENRFLVRVSGVTSQDDDGTERFTVTVDDEQVESGAVPENGAIEFVHTFEETGPHRITVRLRTNDVYESNDVFRKTVRVVEPPPILYVSRQSYPLERYLTQLYNVTTMREVPENLDPYYAVVIQDLAADDLGNVDALQGFVINGNGLVVAGGENAFENGAYSTSSIASMLPVRVGDATGEQARIVLAIDVSGSTAEGRRLQKAIALDVLDQLGDQHLVGLVAFDANAYKVAEPAVLGRSRAGLEDKVRRLQSGRGTRIAAGLRGAAELLGGRGGTVILITDGQDRGSEPVTTARALGTRDTRVIAVGVGSRVNENLLQQIASTSGGIYYRADETNRLRLLFGDERRQFSGSGLTIVDPNHFITAGVTTRATLPKSNDVSVKSGADYLVASGSGDPAIAAWRFGLGRVVSITAYGQDGGLDGLLSEPDSLLVSKSVNWAIGDPERKAAGITELPDTRIGDPTTVTYTGNERPEAADVRFTKVGDNTYRATIVPSRAGYSTLLDAEYAVNYPAEYAGFGQSSAIDEMVEATGGRVFASGDAADIAAVARRQSTAVRDVRDEWDWVFLLAALLVYLIEVATRRLQVYRGTGTPRTSDQSRSQS